MARPVYIPPSIDQRVLEERRRGLSVVVPTFNEEGNVAPLCYRLREVLTADDIDHELIFVDDHSTDQTREVIESLGDEHVCRLYLKQGPRGKAASLLQGFARATYDVVAMIDADLQYPPEALPEMVRTVRRGKADIVVGHRQRRDDSVLRRFCSLAFSWLFVRGLHGMTCDAQSGLKVLRREVLDAVHIENPSPWAFDLDFLLQAQQAGYTTAEQPIAFEERLSGKSKIGLLRASCQLALSAVKLKFRAPAVTSFGQGDHEPAGTGFRCVGREYVHHSAVSVRESAFQRFLPRQKLILAGCILFGAAAFIADWHASALIAVSVMTVLYFGDLGFSLFLIYQAFVNAEQHHWDAVPGDVEREWPMYTILCPLYREWEVLPQFVTAMAHLDYPKHRLEVLLLLEQDDDATLAAASKLSLPAYFHTVVVPHSLPKTKPKACNFGLHQASGEFIVIYDAEDVPDRQQLKKAVLAFEGSAASVVCIQAKLNFYNPSQNLLTRLFTAEYSLWFDLILPGLQACRCPIPLGGTSNHFKRSTLRSLGGWDAFNVTEDCDLGVRLAKRGLQTAILDSTTLEEANSSLANWFPQRTRWIKGYIQTYFVHMRDVRAFGSRSWLEPRLWGFQLVVGGKVFSMLVNPLMWALTITYFVLRPLAPGVSLVIESLFPGPVFYIGVLSLVFGNFLYVYYYMIGCTRRSHDEIVKYALIVPAYWVAMSTAAWLAVSGFIRQPHYWAKTQHGLHLGSRDGLSEAESKVGRLVDDELISGQPAASVIEPVLPAAEPGAGHIEDARSEPVAPSA